MRRVQLATALVALAVAGCPAAASALTISGGSPFQKATIQRLVEVKNRMPDPQDNLEVILAPCPGAAEDSGCTYPTDNSPVWVDPAQFSPFVLYHEMGHRYRFEVMTPRAQARFVAIMHYKAWTDDVEEQFADAYATCAMGLMPIRSHDADEVDENFPTGNQYEPTRRQQDRVCQLILSTAFTPA